MKARIAHVAISYRWQEVDLPNECPECGEALVGGNALTGGTNLAIWAVQNGGSIGWIDSDGDPRFDDELSHGNVLLPYEYGCAQCGHVLAERDYSAVHIGLLTV